MLFKGCGLDAVLLSSAGLRGGRISSNVFATGTQAEASPTVCGVLFSGAGQGIEGWAGPKHTSTFKASA